MFEFEKKNSFYRLIRLIVIGVTVVVAFVVMWWPFIKNLDLTLQVLNRLFPFSRGLFEVHLQIFILKFFRKIYKLPYFFDIYTME